MDPRELGRTRLAAVAVSTFALSLGSVLPATSASSNFVYDALGDSYAAGTGVTPQQAYPNVLNGRMKIALDDFAAVTGATVPTMLAADGGQLGALDADTDLVTISIGGNDIGWTAAIAICLLAPDVACEGAVDGSTADITGPLPGLLDAAYTQVEAAAPDAHVVVTGYPRLFSPEYGAYSGFLTVDLGGGPITLPFEASVAEQQLMNDAADLLNATMRVEAEEHGFQFVDVTERFEDHGVNAPDAWIFGVTDPVPFHPTVKGQHAYGVALRSAIKPPDLR